MTDLNDLEPADGSSETDVLQQALAELEAAIKPLEEDVHLNAHLNVDLAQYYYYLHLLWAEFYIYIIEPFAGGEDSGSDTGTAEIIPLANGRKIFDYGYALATSVGEDYGSYCQSKLFDTIKEMIDMLAKRGVRRVTLIGSSIAMRVAWMECVDAQIETSNYEPSVYDVEARRRIQEVKAKAKKLKPGQELRL